MKPHWIRLCLKGDRNAQAQIYDEYKTPLLEVCMRYAKSREEAEDFLLEGFFKIFRDLHQFNTGNSFEGWCRRIMVNTALMHIRKKHPFETLSLNEAVLQPAHEIDNDFISQLNVNEIIHSIQQLPIGYQTVFNLFAIEGYSHKEIALQLGISESTSRSQYTRAKRHLQQSLSQKKSFSNH